MACFLGIDGGGSALRWCCVDAQGALVQRGKRAAVHPAHGDAGPVAEALAALLAELELAPSAVVIGLAGAGSSTVRSELMRGLREGGVVRDVVLCTDVEVAAAAAFGTDPGVAAWAGTGSFALACSSAGELFRTGGRGFLLGDPLSGHALVRGAARAALRAKDGVAPATGLGDRLVEAVGAERLSALPAVLQRMAPAAVARFAPLVIASAADGDAVAAALVDEQAHALAELVRSAASRAALEIGECRVGGGVLSGSALARDALAGALGGTTRLTVVECDGARAAAQLARWVHDGRMPMAGWVR